MKRIHTLIHQPLELRKQVLEAALDAAEVMKSIDSVQQFDNDGTDLRKQLKTMAQNLQVSFKKLQQELPEVPSEFVKNRDVQPTTTSASPYQQKLYQDIEEIRKKLKQLGN